MDFDRQTILVLAIAAAATSYLLFRGWRALMVKANRGCGGCGGKCGKDSQRSDELDFVPLADLQRNVPSDKTD
jgi:hypothetical protein